MPGSLTPNPLDLSAVSSGPWQEDSASPSNDVQIEDAGGHRIARVYKTSDVDSSSLPWEDNKQLIMDAVGYAKTMAEQRKELADLQDANTQLQQGLQEIARHPTASQRVLARLRKEGVL